MLEKKLLISYDDWLITHTVGAGHNPCKGIWFEA
jgi:hypothetical protein